MDQKQFLAKFNTEKRPKFNPELFKRSEDDIIEAVKKIIYSCQRDQENFKFLVNSFNVIEKYDDIKAILYNYEESLKKGKNKKKVNKYDYVNLKDTDMKLIVVTYYIEAKETKKIQSPYLLTQYICVPRIVNDYYFRIAGTFYSAMYLIADGSTYNNGTSKNTKSDSVVFPTPFGPVRMYKKKMETQTELHGEVFCENYSIATFNRIFNGFRYFFAKFGYYKTLQFLHLPNIQITNTPILSTDIYCFKTNGKIFISIEKVLFDNNDVLQGVICGLIKSIGKHTSKEDLFDINFWKKLLGGEFGKASPEKGNALLSSLEGLYDIKTKEDLHLPDSEKADIYTIVRWMICEFTALRAKDNLDVSTKRRVCANYMASYYAMKQATIIHALTDSAVKNQLDIEKVLKKMRGIKPSFLIDSICKSQLVNYRNYVNDLDSIVALKYTFKSVNTLGSKSSTSIPMIYRYMHPSHLGRFDPDSSSKSDPGLTGIICPLADLHGDSFSEYEEPCDWASRFDQLMRDYNKTLGLKEIIISRGELLGKNVTQELNAVNCSLDILERIMEPVREVQTAATYQSMPIVVPAESGGIIYYERN